MWTLPDEIYEQYGDSSADEIGQLITDLFILRSEKNDSDVLNEVKKCLEGLEHVYETQLGKRATTDGLEFSEAATKALSKSLAFNVRLIRSPQNNHDNIVQSLIEGCLFHAILVITQMLYDDNPLFDPVKFLEDCGLGGALWERREELLSAAEEIVKNK